MFHRISLEAGKLHDARLVKLRSVRGSPRSKETEGETTEGDDSEILDNNESQRHGSYVHQYEELSFRKEASVFFRGNKLPLSFAAYLLFGAIFYHFDYKKKTQDHGGFVFGIYEAITIGYSVGLSPKNPDYIPNPWFSSAYILCGAGLIALNLVVIGRKIEDKASNVVFDGLKMREDYEKDMSPENPFSKRVIAFIKYNTPYLLVILFWIIWMAFITVWSIFATEEFAGLGPEYNWNFAYAQYFAVSLCSSAGSFSLPPNTADWAYGLASLSMMIGVPLMALAISSIVIMVSQGHQFNKVKKAAWEPVTVDEVEALQQLGLVEGDGGISKGGFVLLGMLRMGHDSGIIQYLADAYETSEERGGVLMTDTTRRTEDDDYSKHARAYLERAGSVSNTGGTNRSRLTADEKMWSVAAMKDNTSGRMEAATLESLTERLLDEEEEPTTANANQPKKRWSVAAMKDNTSQRMDTLAEQEE